jgi:hypothetical protein
MPYTTIARDPGPHWTNGRSQEEDRGYRRGFDQGVAALAYALGIDNQLLQETAFKKRVADFRHYRLREAPWQATPQEVLELLELIKR